MLIIKKSLKLSLAAMLMLLPATSCVSNDANYQSEAITAPSVQPDKAEQRAAWAQSLFSGVEQYDSFHRVSEMFPTSIMSAASDPYDFKENLRLKLPETVVSPVGQVDTAQLLAETDTAALIVLHNGELVYENYWLTGARQTRWISMSMAKSVTSIGVGIAVDEGLIDIQRPVEDYVPELKGSGYEGASVKDVLQASSGIAWNENYSDPESSVIRMRAIIAGGGSMGELAASMQREFEPGTKFRYSSMETFVLGMVLSRATGESVSSYLERKLWHPLGMETDAYWLLDSDGAEMTQFGLNATARDYAKIGELYRQNGMWEGKQVVSAEWVKASTTADAPIREPKPTAPGYGYQWWLPYSADGDFVALGVYLQAIYVNPAKRLVIVKLSAYSDYATDKAPPGGYAIETFSLFNAIGQQLEAKASGD
ncbi:MAG: serine hydrolase [Pseudomonadota bacterium]